MTRVKKAITPYLDELHAEGVPLFRVQTIAAALSNSSAKQQPNRASREGALWLLHFCLAFLSLCTIAKIMLYRIFHRSFPTVHFLIDQGRADYRSEPIINILPLSQTINFYHSGNLRRSLSSSWQKSNAIYFESLFYTMSPFLGSAGPLPHFPSSNERIVLEFIRLFEENFPRSVRMSDFLRRLLTLLSIKSVLLIDDGRSTNELIYGCKKIGIQTTSYMHNRFNEFHYGLFYFPVDRALVWSPYFATLLQKRTPSCSTVVTGHLRIGRETSPSSLPSSKKTNILWLGESNVTAEEIFCYLMPLIDSNLYTIIYRGKPNSNQSNISAFLEQHGITSDLSLRFQESLATKNISLVLGTHSTALLECYLFQVPSLMIRCSYDYGIHMVRDNLTWSCSEPNLMVSEISKILDFPSSEIEARRMRIWGDNPFINVEVVRHEIKNLAR